MGKEMRPEKQCPVCGAELKHDAVRCSTCDADLEVVKKLAALPETLGQMAIKAHASGNQMQAASYLQIARELDPENLDLAREHARQLEEAGLYALTADIWREIIARHPEDEEAAKKIAELEKFLRPSGVEEKSVVTKSLIMVPCLIMALLAGWFAHILFPSHETGVPEKTVSAATSVNSNQVPTTSSATDTPAIATVKAVSSADKNIAKVNKNESPIKEKTTSTVANLAATSQPSPEDKEKALNSRCQNTAAAIALLKQGAFSKVVTDVRKGGLFVKGSVAYPWQRTLFESSLKQKKGCLFYDMTGLQVSKPCSMRYQVKKGDNLSLLAMMFYGNPRYWQKIYAENRHILAGSPDLLKPGMELIIPGSTCSEKTDW